MELLVGILGGVVIVLVIALVFAKMRGRGGSSIVLTSGGLEGLRRVGELVVLRAYWSIPAIGSDHIFGDTGKKFLRWLWGENKTIMIFRFEIRFKYDLRDSRSVSVSPAGPGVLEVRLGPPKNEINLADMRFYHTEKGQLLDWLLPRALNIFQSEMDDETRQKILEAAQANARVEAERKAEELVPDARLSAESILTALGRSAGFSEVRILQAEATRQEAAIAGQAQKP